MADHIAFFRKNPWPTVNTDLVRTVSSQFPHSEVDVFDIANILKAERLLINTNTLHILRHYAVDILLGRKKIRDAFWRTPYIHTAIKKLVTRLAPANRFRFSIQVQALFDASQPGLTHFIYTDHTHLANLWYPGYHPGDQYASSWITLERNTYHHASLVFSRSSHISRSLIEQYGLEPSKVETVYAGISPDWNQAYTLNPSKYASKTILFVGTDWEKKGGLDLIAAFKIVRDVHPDARLVIVGCNPTLHEPNVTVMGKIPQERVNSLFEQSAVFCLPSTLEPYGLVIIEALFHMLPVVATSVGAIPDMVINGETGMLVPVHSPKELADALCCLIAHPETCRQYGENGYWKAQAKYNWVAVGQLLRSGILTRVGTTPSDTLPQKRTTGNLSPANAPSRPGTGPLSPDRLENRKPTTGSLPQDRLRKPGSGSLAPDSLPRKIVTGSLSSSKPHGEAPNQEGQP